MAVPGKKVGQQFTTLTSKYSDDTLKVYCQPCDKDGITLSAHGYCKNCCEHLCESCFNFHRKHTLSRDHFLLDKTIMPQTIQPSSTAHYSGHDNLMKPCPKHKKESIKYFCDIHNAFLCSVCVTLEHQPTTCKISYIPDISENVIDSKEYQEILKTMDAISLQYHEIKHRADNAFSRSKSSLENVLVGIKKFRKEINKRLDELEMQTELAANNIQQESSENFSTVETACNGATNILQTSSDNIKQFNTSKQADELFMELKYANQTIRKYGEELSDLANICFKEYYFTPNEAVSTLLTKEKSLGTLVKAPLKTESTEPLPIKSGQFSCQGEIRVKTSEDKYECWISGITLTNPDLLIITDCENKAVKMVDINSQMVTDQLQLDTIPHDVTRVSNTKLAVTLPFKQTIQIVSILKKKLTQKSIIKVNGDCLGISCYQNKLVVSFCSPAKLQILDINGTILQSFEDGHFIEMAVPGKKAGQKLTASQQIKDSDEELKVYCQPCDRDGPRLPAHGFCKNCCEHLCEPCFNFHKKHTLSRDHILQNKTNMPKILQHSSIDAKKPDNLTKPCSEHKREVVKFFCQDHNALLCSVCVTLGHQPTSCEVSYIPDISTNVINGKEYSEILKTMDTISNQFHKIKNHVKKAISKSNNSLSIVLKDIKDFRKEINQRLDELEIQAESTANDMLHENTENLNKVETACDDAINVFQTTTDTFKQLNASQTADVLFFEIKNAEQMLKDYKKTLADLVNFDIKQYNFTPDETISTFLTRQTSLGTLLEKPTTKTKCTSAASQLKSSRQFVCKGDFSVITTQDRKRCWITGMALLTPDLLIITDYNNKSVKMLDIVSQSVTNQLQLETSPRDITTVNSLELTVTLPYEQSIQFVSILSNKLNRKQKMKVDGECRGISCFQDKLIVSFTNPAKLQILDINGTVLKIFEDEQVRSPLYITANSRFIYVSDWEMKTVTIFNWQGCSIGSYGNNSDMEAPKGISLTDDGTVFVCDEKRNVIEEISGDCSTGRIVLKDRQEPYAVSWCGKTRTLYNSSFTGYDKDDNVVKMTKVTESIKQKQLC
ncbi:uncharacterized protein LOC132757390 [Ruditapes philippinarum]|uniref:uncharacterized protein LOC132757390 n=1 Tax=Ruditapes philippinarum TaxID=129788 RepID=UPI00295A87E3|nr:uncharacterized protein LOC132757390 [Ruditapes philippinarum]